ncbi:MAG: type 4a pilus biogenesis protein PilO [Candidatus Omnitrophota bacterium]
MITVEELIIKIQKNFVNIAVCVICVIVALRIYSAQNNRVEAIRAETDLESQKSAVLHDISNYESRFKKLHGQVNIKDDTAVINTLNTIAKDSQVKIIVLRPMPQEKISGYIRYPYSMSIAVDNYHMLGKFISVLESHPFMFSIVSMNVEADTSDESKRYKMQVNLEISTILVKD